MGVGWEGREVGFLLGLPVEGEESLVLGLTEAMHLQLQQQNEILPSAQSNPCFTIQPTPSLPQSSSFVLLLLSAVEQVFLNSMGQTECCEASATPTHLIANPQLKLFQVQSDPTEASEKPAYLTSRSSTSKRLGNFEQGEFIEARPTLPSQVRQTISSLQSLELECYRRLQSDRGIAEPNCFYRFARTGIVFEGEWYNSKPHGFGRNYYPNGGFYEGTFCSGLPHGYGRFISQNGDYYQGEVKFGRGNGVGHYYTKDIVFHGHFRDNVLEGQGEEKGPDYYFKGTYECGTKKDGVFKFNGNIYEGSFENDEFDGKGVLTTSEGKYVGHFQNGLQHGYGQFEWKNGSKYRGNYRRGVRQGDGEFYNGENNSIWRGIWRRGVLQGEGEFVEPRGMVNRVVWSESRVSAIR